MTYDIIPKMKVAYKIVHVRNKKRESCVTVNRNYKVLYPKNSIVFPKKEGTLGLMVFDTLKNAVNFKVNFSYKQSCIVKVAIPEEEITIPECIGDVLYLRYFYEKKCGYKCSSPFEGTLCVPWLYTLE